MFDDLTSDQRSALEGRIAALFTEAFEDPISPFRAGQILDLVLKVIGPEIYNQAVADAREHLQAKLDDLDGDVYWPPESD